MKNIIITGASSGIGYSLAKEYAKSEANNLLLIARDKNRLQTLQSELKYNSIIAACDVTDREELQQHITKFDEQFPVDLIIANAGISAGTANGGESEEQFRKIFDINIWGVTNSIFPLIEKMKQRKSGQIAIMSSLAAFQPLPSAPAYSASKACVRFIAESLRGELKPYNIKVSSICPGYIKTPLTDKNNFPMPFLISSEKAAKKIIKGLEKNKMRITFPWQMYFLVKFMSCLPIFITEPIFNRLPKK